MRLEEARRRLPVLNGPLPPGRSRRTLPAKAGEAPKPGLAVWEITLACDHGCLHCGARAGRAREDELATAEALQLVDEMAELGIGEVVLIGGEAYLRNDLPLVVRRIRERGMACTMTTGGLNLNERRIEILKEAGMQSINFSIDGLEEAHDKVRDRPGSWQAAWKAQRLTRAAGIRTGVNTQINAYTHEQMPEMVELLGKAGVRVWQIQPTVAHGNAADNPEILLQPYMMPDVFRQLDKVIDRANELNIKVFPGNNLGYFGPGEHKLQFRRRGARHFMGCDAGRRVLGVESNGAIKNCPTLGAKQNIGGSWRDHGLKDIWERAPEMSYIRERTEDSLWGYCKTCYYAETCMAGCTATAEALMGRPGNNPMCHHRALEMERQGLRERVERVGTAGGEAFDNGVFRVIREYADADKRAKHGPVAIENPRISRVIERLGPGRELEPA